MVYNITVCPSFKWVKTHNTKSNGCSNAAYAIINIKFQK